MLSVTSPAQAKIKEVLQSPEAAVRLEVIRGPHGCVHGWRLVVEETADANEVVYVADGVKLVVERDLLPVVQDATIDYREDATAIGFTMDVPGAEEHGHAHARGNGHGGCGHHH